jgi:hypothetical protein
MTYTEQKLLNGNRRFSRIRNFTFGQCMAIMAIVVGVCVVIFGAYFLFSVL